MNVYVDERTIARWIVETGQPDRRLDAGCLGQIVFVLDRGKFRINSCGCAQLDSDGIQIVDKATAAARAEELKTSQPHALPRLRRDYEKLLEATRTGKRYWVLPAPKGSGATGALRDADYFHNLCRSASAVGIELILQRQDSLKELEKQTDEGDSALTERKDFVFQFLDRPQMLDAWTIKVAPFVYEYSAGASTDEIVSGYKIASSDLSKAFQRVRQIADGSKQPKKRFYEWVPPGQLRASVPRPVKAGIEYFFPDSPDHRRYTEMYGENNRQVLEELTTAARELEAHRGDTTVAANLGRIIDAADKLGIPQDEVAEHLGNLRSEWEWIAGAGPTSRLLPDADIPVSVLKHSDLKAWLKTAGLKAAELAEISLLRPSVIENFVRRPVSPAAVRRILQVMAACDHFWATRGEEFATDESGAVRFNAKGMPVLRPMTTGLEEMRAKFGYTREAAIRELRLAVWRIMINSISTDLLAADSELIEEAGENVIGAREVRAASV